MYYFNEFDTVSLDEDQASKCLGNFLLIDWSSKFQVHVFKPHCDLFKQLTYCVYAKAVIMNIEQMNSLKKYPLTSNPLNKINLSSINLATTREDELY